MVKKYSNGTNFYKNLISLNKNSNNINEFSKDNLITLPVESDFNKKTKISELEKLINQSPLVAPIPYNNPKRKKQKFFDFIEGYGDYLNVPINEIKLSIVGQYKLVLSDLYNRFSGGYETNGGLFQNILNTTSAILYLPQMPLIGVYGSRLNNDNHVEIYKGNSFQRLISSIQLDPLVHEYLHAYQHLMITDLHNRGLIKLPSNSLGLIQPRLFGFQFKSPSKKYLKNYEKKIIKKLIKLL